MENLRHSSLHYMFKNRQGIFHQCVCGIKDRQGVFVHTQMHSQTFYECVFNYTIIVYVSDMTRKR